MTECCTLPRGIQQPPFESERQAEQEDRVIRSNYRTRLSGQFRIAEGEQARFLDYKVVNETYPLSRENQGRNYRNPSNPGHFDRSK